MSPYYKAAATGKRPKPRDWCGVFVSLHEKRTERWRERAYSYNLYDHGDFGEMSQTVGGARIVRDNNGSATVWRVTADESGLWRGRTQVEMTFAATGPALALPAMGGEEATSPHTWVCVAPVCRAEGAVTLASGEVVRFAGNGYHDHNFGVLPYEDAEYWQWGRVPLRRDRETEPSHTAVYYHIAPPATAEADTPPQTTLLVFDAAGQPVTARTVAAVLPPQEQGGSYGMRYERTLLLGDAGAGEPTLTATVRDRAGVFSNGPFYARFPVHAEFAEVTENHTVTPAVWRGDGIGEAFRPARLCGPIASRAMWSRIRRRRS